MKSFKLFICVYPPVFFSAIVGVIVFYGHFRVLVLVHLKYKLLQHSVSTLVDKVVNFLSALIIRSPESTNTLKYIFFYCRLLIRV